MHIKLSSWPSLVPNHFGSPQFLHYSTRFWLDFPPTKIWGEEGEKKAMRGRNNTRLCMKALALNRYLNKRPSIFPMFTCSASPPHEYLCLAWNGAIASYLISTLQSLLFPVLAAKMTLLQCKFDPLTSLLDVLPLLTHRLMDTIWILSGIQSPSKAGSFKSHLLPSISPSYRKMHICSLQFICRFIFYTSVPLEISSGSWNILFHHALEHTMRPCLKYLPSQPLSTIQTPPLPSSLLPFPLCHLL